MTEMRGTEGSTRCVRALLIVCLLLLLAGVAGAEPYTIGDHIEPFTLEDQHGVSHTLDGDVAVLLFSRDMKGGDALKAALADAPEGFLAERRAIYISDISGMPAIISRMFAIPGMRDRAYPMWLDRDGETTARLPDERGKATLIFCDDQVITSVAHLETPEEVRTALEGMDQAASAQSTGD
jgi:hypothetical protein